MKKKYETPIIEIIELEKKDFIVMSQDDDSFVDADDLFGTIS